MRKTIRSDFLKRIFAIAPLQVKAYLNLNDPDDPKNANNELSIVSTAISQQTQDALNLKAEKVTYGLRKC